MAVGMPIRGGLAEDRRLAAPIGRGRRRWLGRGVDLQASLLEDTWSDDIDNYKLNIVFEVVSRDDAGGAAQVAIRSGIGTGAADLCSEPSSETAVIDVQYDAAASLWSSSAADGTCSAVWPMLLCCLQDGGTAVAGVIALHFHASAPVRLPTDLAAAAAEALIGRGDALPRVLTDLAVNHRVSASTQDQALAILSLYRGVRRALLQPRRGGLG